MLGIILKLALIHVIGDFVLQPGSWTQDKVEKKIKSKYLYFHILVHLVVFLLVFKFQQKYIAGALFTVVTHYLIDLGKIYLTRINKPILLFIGDQLLHVLMIAILAYFYAPYTIDFDVIFSDKTILFLTSALTITYAVAILIKTLMQKWNLDEIDEASSANDSNPQEQSTSLASAGMYIGMLERLFIFGFIILNQWSGIGFLLAAKSIFRFGDLSKGKDRKLTEYILIGTLLSFGLAIIIALAYKKLSQLPTLWLK